MKQSIIILKTQLEYQRYDLRINKLMLKDKSNSIEMNLYFKDNIKINLSKIESLKKAITVLKEYK